MERDRSSPRVPRVFHPALAPAADDITLDTGESAHLVRVLRMRAGEPVAVFDGAGRERDGVIVEVRSAGVRVHLGVWREDRVEAGIDVTLFQGLCRPERLEWVLQKTTEVGVAAFFAVTTERSEAPEPTPGRLERWKRIVVEAAKQCGRRRLPRLGTIDSLPEAPPGVAAIALDPDAGTPALGTLLTGPAPSEVWLAVGPEGGFTPSEIASLRGTGWAAAGLGPRVLRTETAGIVAATLVLHRWGDLGSAAAGPVDSGGGRP